MLLILPFALLAGLVRFLPPWSATTALPEERIRL
jgi:hypothetical protein